LVLTILRLVSIKITGNAAGRLALRPASLADMRIVHEWQCHPETRRFARNPSPPEFEDHQKWFEARLASRDCILAMILQGGEPAGILRFDRKADQEPEVWEVSILVAPGKKSRGVGSAALALGRRLVPEAELVAEVLDGNNASHRLFHAAGYVLEGDGLYHSYPV
jgi:RimJ/RimL family protein N-acetyltransferase